MSLTKQILTIIDENPEWSTVFSRNLTECIEDDLILQSQKTLYLLRNTLQVTVKMDLECPAELVRFNRKFSTRRFYGCKLSRFFKTI